MKNDERARNLSHHSGDPSKGAYERMARRRRALRRQTKRVARRVTRLTEDVVLKGTATMLRLTRKVVGRIVRGENAGSTRRRINVAD